MEFQNLDQKSCEKLGFAGSVPCSAPCQKPKHCRPHPCRCRARPVFPTGTAPAHPLHIRRATPRTPPLFWPAIPMIPRRDPPHPPHAPRHARHGLRPHRIVMRLPAPRSCPQAEPLPGTGLPNLLDVSIQKRGFRTIPICGNYSLSSRGSPTTCTSV